MKTFLQASFLFVLITLNGFSQSEQNSAAFKRVDYEIGVGALLPGTIYISMIDDNVLTSTSFALRAFIDAYLVENLSLGLYGNLAFINLNELESSSEPIADEYSSATAYEFGASFKVPLRVAESIELKPGFSFGYRRIHSKLASESYDYYTGETETTGDVEGLGMNGSLELVLLMSENISPFLEFGFVAQATGGNKLTDLTFGPILYIIAGIQL